MQNDNTLNEEQFELIPEFEASRRLITRQKKLWHVVKACRKQRVIGIDTESNSFWAYREQVCIIQIIAGKRVFLLDPLKLEDLSPLGQVFHDPGIIKIFHGADYDLRCLSRDFGLEPAPIFDTMVAALFLDYPALGLGALVKRHFGVDLPKSNALTRYNWAERPLPDKQFDYMINDVIYLQRLREILVEQLRQKDLTEEVEWEFRQLEQLPQRRQNQPDPAHTIWAIKGAKTLEPLEQCVLRQLNDHRECLAEDMDLPRFKVLSNKVLIEIARRQPKRKDQLAGIKGMTPGMVQRFGRGVLEAVKAGLEDFEGGRIPQAPQVLSVRGPQMDSLLVDNLKKWRKEEAEKWSISPQAVLPTFCLKEIARATHLDPLALSQIPGMIPARMEKYASRILEIAKME
jgi:ribonuclease D